MKRITCVISLIFLLIFTATGCIHEEVTYEFNKDGTGSLTALFTVSEAFSEGNANSDDNIFGISSEDLQAVSGVTVTQRAIEETVNGEKYTGTEILMNIPDMELYIASEGSETLKVNSLANGNKRLEFVMAGEEASPDPSGTETTPEQTAQTVAMMKSLNAKMALSIKTDYQVVTSNGINAGDGIYSWDLLEMALQSSAAPVTCYIEYVPSAEDALRVPVAPKVPAKVTTAKVLVNGKEAVFEAYNIDGNNYFKLRDVAMSINGTQKQFGVAWDLTKQAINLTSNSAYLSDGSEMVKGDGKSRLGTINRSPIYKDGVIAVLTAYNINGYNYFKLRDLGSSFNIGIGWDELSKTIAIDTSKGYEEE